MKKTISPCSSRGHRFACRGTPRGLLLDDANASARAIAWMFTAINTVELPRLLRPSKEEEARKFPHLTSLLH